MQSICCLFAPGFSPLTAELVTFVVIVLQALRALADQVEAHPDLVSSAVHSMSVDYLHHRLPPHPKQLPPQGECLAGVAQQHLLDAYYDTGACASTFSSYAV